MGTLLTKYCIDSPPTRVQHELSKQDAMTTTKKNDTKEKEEDVLTIVQDDFVDMRKFTKVYTDDVITEGKKAALLGEDIHEIVEDWKVVLGACSYLVDEFPTMIGALKTSETIATKCTELLVAPEKLVYNVPLIAKDTRTCMATIDTLYQNRLHCMHEIVIIERWTHNVAYIVHLGIEFCQKHDHKAKDKATKKNTSFLERFTQHQKHAHKKEDTTTHTTGTTPKPTTVHTNSPPTTTTTTSSPSVATATTAAAAAGTISPHISVKSEGESVLAKLDDKAHSLVTDGEDIVHYVKRNAITLEHFVTNVMTLQDDWKTALHCIAHIQTIIPLVTEAIHEVQGIADLIRDCKSTIHYYHANWNIIIMRWCTTI